MVKATAKSSQKTTEKPIEKVISKTKKTKKRKYESFSMYIYRLFKTFANKSPRISSKSMLIMNNLVNDFLEMIAVEAGRLVAHGKKTTLTSRDIQTAVKLILPGELAAHACIEGIKALATYRKNVQQTES